MTIKNGRPPYEPTPQGAKLVKELAGHGVPQTAIATTLGIHVETLGKYYGREFAVGKAKANAKVAKSLFQKATGSGPSAVTAAIFWAKTQMGWREQSPQDGQTTREPDYSVLSHAELATLLDLLGRVEGGIPAEYEGDYEALKQLAQEEAEGALAEDGGRAQVASPEA